MLVGTERLDDLASVIGRNWCPSINVAESMRAVLIWHRRIEAAKSCRAAPKSMVASL